MTQGMCGDEALKTESQSQTALKESKAQHSDGRERAESVTAGRQQHSCEQHSRADSDEGHNQTTLAGTSTDNISAGIDVGSNNRHGVFDLETTVGTGAINTQLKANETNMKAAQGGRIVSVLIELESSKYAKNVWDKKSLKAGGDENAQV